MRMPIFIIFSNWNKNFKNTSNTVVSKAERYKVITDNVKRALSKEIHGLW